MSTITANGELGRVTGFYSSVVGKKVVMAVTGFILFGFILVHMLANLQVFLQVNAAGVPPLDAYAEHLRALPPLLWGTRVVLLVAVILHILAAVQLWGLNKFEARKRGYTPGYFSFNIPGGRCETCQGDGTVTVEMQFLADVELICEECKGARYKPEVLEVRYRGKNIHEVLDLTVREALQFFAAAHRVTEKLRVLEEIGLYHPIEKQEKQVTVNEAKVKSWMEHGATPSATVKRLLNRVRSKA